MELIVKMILIFLTSSDLHIGSWSLILKCYLLCYILPK